MSYSESTKSKRLLSLIYLALLTALVTGTISGIQSKAQAQGKTASASGKSAAQSKTQVPAQALANDKRSQGIAQYNAKDYKTAAQTLDDYLTVNNRDPYAAYYAALANQQLGYSAKSRLLYRQVYTLAPTSQIGGYAKAMLLKLDPTFASTIAAAEATAAASAKGNEATAAQTPEDIARAIINGTSGNATAGGGSSSTSNRSTPSVSTASASADSKDTLDPTMPGECRIPFVRSTNGVDLDCYINNRPIKMKFDTGAPNVVVGKNHLTALGISLPTGPPNGETGGSASADKIPFWIIKATVKTGNMEKRDMPVMVLEYDHSPPLLGQTFFRKYVYTIDDKAGQINFKQKALANNDSLGGAAVSVPFKYIEAGGRVMVTVEVNGKPMPMIFDTGNTASACSFMSEGQAKRAGITIPADARDRTHIGVNGPGACKEFPISRLRLGPIDKSDILVSVNTDVTDSNSGGLEAPLLGQPFWQDYQYTIDMQHKLIHFIRR